jgi:predicted nucleic acid-binding protein
MVTFYFDTSAIVKRYHKEAGSEVLDKTFELKEHGSATSL